MQASIGFTFAATTSAPPPPLVPPLPPPVPLTTIPFHFHQLQRQTRHRRPPTATSSTTSTTATNIDLDDFSERPTERLNRELLPRIQPLHPPDDLIPIYGGTQSMESTSTGCKRKSNDVGQEYAICLMPYYGLIIWYPPKPRLIPA
ncbi:hypothetical protein LXL04_005381 [Taraxacum kok-saghyz]